MADFPDFAFASDDEIARTLGARLKALRLSAGHRQVDLAARAGVSPATVKALENQGTGNLSSLIRVVRALGLESGMQAWFLLPEIRSIAEMEARAAPRRRRAPPPPKR